MMSSFFARSDSYDEEEYLSETSDEMMEWEAIEYGFDSLEDYYESIIDFDD